MIMARSWTHFFAILIINSMQLFNVYSMGETGEGRFCHSCDGVRCQMISFSNDSMECSDKLDSCVTIFDKHHVEAKGCFSKIASKQRQRCSDENNFECQKCYGNLCNKHSNGGFKCVECTSKQDINCAFNASKIPSVYCSPSTAANLFCYIKKMSNGIIERGCLTRIRYQLDCLRDENCSICISEGKAACNDFTIRDGINISSKTLANNCLLIFIMISGVLSHIKIYFRK